MDKLMTSTTVISKAATAYMWSRGWAALVISNDSSIKKLTELQEVFRNNKQYIEADKLRDIIENLQMKTDYVRPDLWMKDGTIRT